MALRVNLSNGLGEQWIDSACQTGNAKILFDTRGPSFSSKEALSATIIISRRMAKLSPEQNIGILLPTSASGMLTNMATMLLGKTAVNLNFTASIDSLLSAIEQAEISSIYSSSYFLQKLTERGIDVGSIRKICTVITLEELTKKVSTLEKATTLLMCKFSPVAFLKARYSKPVNLDQTAVILFSSGSEGAPKGIILSHFNLLTNISQIAQAIKFKDDDIILANLPLFHSLGLTVTQLLPLLMRIPVVCHADPLDVYTNARTIEKFSISIIFGTSSFYRLYIRNPKINAQHLKSVRLAVAGAEKLQPQVIKDFQDKFNLEIYEGYGATETSPVAAVNIPHFLNDTGVNQHITYRPGSVGLPVSGTKIIIVDPQSFTPLSSNESGMILINGGQVMQGYLKNDQKTVQALKIIDNQCWYVSGDKGRIDEEGFLYIEDRYSRFAKIAGEMVGLSNIEIAIKAVSEDQQLEVIVVTVPDPKKGEQIVVLSTSVLEQSILRRKLIDFGLPTIALPTRYLTIAKIPYLGSGKTDYTTAKQLALADAQ